MKFRIVKAARPVSLQIWVWSVSNIKINVEYTKLYLGSKYLIMGSKYFH
jgi:hypothetical protein